jgi:hypothetical protein
MSRGRLTNQLYHGPAADRDDDGIHHHAHLDDRDDVVALASRIRRSRAEQPITPEIIELAAEWRELEARFDQVDLPWLQEMHRGLSGLEARRESLVDSVEQLQQRLADETAERGVVTRFRRRKAIEELESDLAQVQATLADVTQQSGSIQASLVGLPDQQELRWMLDRRFAIDMQLRHAASMRVRAFRSEPPAYLINALGQPPTDSWSLSRWERTATDIEKHRLRWEITDKRNALGSELGDPRMERACSRLRDEIDRTVQELSPRHVRQRTFARGR